MGCFGAYSGGGQAERSIMPFAAPGTMSRSPCGPTTPILTFSRVFPFPPSVRRRSRPFLLTHPGRTVSPSVSATAHRLRLALREVADSLQSDRLLHRALSHRRCDPASIHGFPRIRGYSWLRRVDVAISSRRSRNRWNALCLDSTTFRNHDPEWSRTPQRKRNPVSAASESGP